MGNVVYAKHTAAVQFEGGARVIARGDAWDDDHQVVKDHPDLFESEPARVAGRKVERATRAPGERSNAKAPTAAEKRKATLAAKKAAAEKESGSDGTD